MSNFVIDGRSSIDKLLSQCSLECQKRSDNVDDKRLLTDRFERSINEYKTDYIFDNDFSNENIDRLNFIDISHSNGLYKLSNVFSSNLNQLNSLNRNLNTYDQLNEKNQLNQLNQPSQLNQSSQLVQHSQRNNERRNEFKKRFLGHLNQANQTMSSSYYTTGCTNRASLDSKKVKLESKVNAKVLNFVILIYQFLISFAKNKNLNRVSNYETSKYDQFDKSNRLHKLYDEFDSLSSTNATNRLTNQLSIETKVFKLHSNYVINLIREFIYFLKPNQSKLINLISLVKFVNVFNMFYIRQIMFLFFTQIYKFVLLVLIVLISKFKMCIRYFNDLRFVNNQITNFKLKHKLDQTRSSTRFNKLFNYEQLRNLLLITFIALNLNQASAFDYSPTSNTNYNLNNINGFNGYQLLNNRHSLSNSAKRSSFQLNKNNKLDTIVFEDPSNEQFTHLQLNPFNNDVYIGAVNRIYQLNSNLQVKHVANMGPSLDSPECPGEFFHSH